MKNTASCRGRDTKRSSRKEMKEWRDGEEGTEGWRGEMRMERYQGEERWRDRVRERKRGMNEGDRGSDVFVWGGVK